MAASSSSDWFVPRFGRYATVPRLTLKSFLKSAFVKLGYEKPTAEQELAILQFIAGRDVFVSLPTGEGKSLIYATLPLLFQSIRGHIVVSRSTANNHICIVLVVSPLSSLMEDQVSNFHKKGLSCVALHRGENQAIMSRVISGEFQIVYLSPETLLQDLRVREMFRSDVYMDNLVALVVDEAHCIHTWGAAFRKEFQNIGEARSIIPPTVNVIALTATASSDTRKVIQKSLSMSNCSTVLKIPNKHNIRYSVKNKEDLFSAFLPVVQAVQDSGRLADKCLIFCRTYDATVEVHEHIASELGKLNLLFIDGEAICDIFTSSSHEKSKSHILAQFTDPNGTLRVIVATIAFGMGIDAPNVRNVIHWGSPKSIEDYVQESGRCGRDGEDSTAILYFSCSDFSGFHPPADTMKAYCLNKQYCRREKLMEVFDTAGSFTRPIPTHRCCDICSMSCDCDNCLYVKAAEAAENEICYEQETVQNYPRSSRNIEALKQALFAYRLSLLSDHNAPIFGIEVATGLSDSLICDIACNPHKYSLDSLIRLGLSRIQAERIVEFISEC